MKNKLEILILCLFCQFCFGQTLTRKPLHGQVVNDSIQIDNGSVYNMNSNISASISSGGFFDILTKEKDTLLFSGFAFKSRKVIVTTKDFVTSLLKVKVSIVTNHLTEVIIDSKNIMKPNFGTIKDIMDRKYFDDKMSSPKNSTMPNYNVLENGVNFVRLFYDVVGLIKGKSKKTKEIVPDENFIEVASKGVNRVFFTNTLKIVESQIGLFLIFCDNDPKSKTHLNLDTEFQRIDFLISKSKEFKNLTTFKI